MNSTTNMDLLFKAIRIMENRDIEARKAQWRREQVLAAKKKERVCGHCHTYATHDKRNCPLKTL